MAERYLIDTSAVIKYLNESLPESGLDFIDQALDTDSSISSLQRSNFRFGIHPTQRML